MAYDDLSDFLTEAEHAGELVRVGIEVDPVLEIAEVTRRVTESGGPAILFERVRGTSIPVVTNLLGSERRLSRILNAESLGAVEERIERLLRPEIAEGWLGSLKMLPQLTQLTRLPPKSVKSGRSQQVVRMGRDIDLREFPLLQSWPRENAAALTAGQIISIHPETGQRHVGNCPLTVRGQDQLAIHWTPQDVAFRHFEGYRAERRQMPIAIVLGGDPALRLLASVPLPREADAYLLAGFLRDKNVDLVKARTLELDVPAGADLVIEGRIDTEADPEPAGRVALPGGFYAIPRDCPTVHVTAVTHRSNPVLPATIPSPPPSEQTWIDRGALALLRPIVKLMVPEIVDLHCPASGPQRSHCFVSIQKEYPQQARKVMNALWGLQGFAATKWIVVVDADVDVRDEPLVWFLAGANVHPARDIQFCDGPTDFNDHAAPAAGLGQKIGVDATRKRPDEGHPRDWPDRLEMTRQMQEFVHGRWSEYGFDRGRRP